LSSVKAYKGELLTVITVERVPKKRMEEFTTADGSIPDGVTLSPVKAVGGFQKIEVLIREKLTRDKARLVLAHELFHCLQYLTGCAMDESHNNDVDVIMAAALKERRGKK
jgi:hypothetical protein